MYQLEEKTYFVYFIAIGILLFGYLILFIWKKNKQRHFGNQRLLNRLSPERSNFKAFIKVLVVALGLSALIIALVNPKIGTKLETVKREGVDIVFALDVSKSMLAEDIAPNRLEKAKQIISKIIEKLGSDRVGIIVYAGNAYPLLPITTDQAAAHMFLRNAVPDMVSSQGTAINEALKLGISYFDDNEQTNRYLFLVSDGEDHEEDTDFVTENAVKQGVKIITIGVGGTQGAPIPIKINNHNTYKKDRNGETVITKRDNSTLQTIAKNGNGIYLDGNNTTKTVDTINDLLLKAEKTEFETQQFSDFKDQFQWFIGIAIFLLVIDTLMYNKKTKWIQQLNLFNEKNEIDESH
ncbi:MAG: BatB protein [Flavobacteriales bacterium]|nr:MAG: BatB protein [Flavobacteriales bacterium]PIE48813.1 MAG: BatB protein [Flavobacteriales bacterium]